MPLAQLVPPNQRDSLVGEADADRNDDGDSHTWSFRFCKKGSGGPNSAEAVWGCSRAETRVRLQDFSSLLVAVVQGRDCLVLHLYGLRDRSTAF